MPRFYISTDERYPDHSLHTEPKDCDALFYRDGQEPAGIVATWAQGWIDGKIQDGWLVPDLSTEIYLTEQEFIDYSNTCRAYNEWQWRIEGATE